MDDGLSREELRAIIRHMHSVQEALRSQYTMLSAQIRGIEEENKVLRDVLSHRIVGILMNSQQASIDELTKQREREVDTEGDDVVDSEESSSSDVLIVDSSTMKEGYQA